MFYFLVEYWVDKVITLTNFTYLELAETGKVTILKKIELEDIANGNW